MNKCGKFCVKIFLHYIDIAIFALGYFILPHPVVQCAQLQNDNRITFCGCLCIITFQNNIKYRVMHQNDEGTVLQYNIFEMQCRK